MDRLSQRLAASLIADRHRAAAQARRASQRSDDRSRSTEPARTPGTAGTSTRLANRLRAFAGAIAAVVMLSVVAAPVSAAPVERTRSIVDCDGADVTLVMHPGSAAPVQWDISVEEVENAPSYFAKYIEADIYIDGQYARSFSTSFGQMVGLGEPLSCTFEVHRPGFDAYGYTELVLIPAP